jgi:hypothetical protein
MQPGHGPRSTAFDAVAPILKDKANAADVAMAKTMSGYWVAFVKTGDPNGDGRPECVALRSGYA